MFWPIRPALSVASVSSSGTRRLATSLLWSIVGASGLFVVSGGCLCSSAHVHSACDVSRLGRWFLKSPRAMPCRMRKHCEEHCSLGEVRKGRVDILALSLCEWREQCPTPDVLRGSNWIRKPWVQSPSYKDKRKLAFCT